MNVQHGLYATYKVHHCRCVACRKASSEYTTRRTRQIAYGRWEPYVDAEPVRQHVRALGEAGIGWKRAARLAGLETSVVWKLLYGHPQRGLAPSKRVRPATAQKLMAVKATEGNLGGAAQVDATGTRRRIQALVAVGWSQSKIAERIGMGRSNFGAMLERSRVQAATARTVRALYDELWDCPPPEAEWRDKIAASRARGYAAERGWAPPLAWDDGTIDDPAAIPVGVGTDSKRGKLPAADDIAWLVAGGDSIEVIADRYGAEVASVKQALHRARKEATS